MTPDTLTQALARYAARTGTDGLHSPVAALIDMDGTLYDSMPWHARAWHRMVTALGINAQVDEFFAYEGMTGKATIDLLFQRAFGRHVTDDEARRLYQIKTENFVADNHTTVMPGAQRMVATLRAHGITPVLVTGSGQATLINRLDADFDGAFAADRRITSHNVTHGKPSPEPYLKALELAGCDARRAIVIENAPLGVQSGVAAGVFTVAVKTGPIPKQQLADARADVVFDSMPDFADALPALLDIIPN